MTTNDNDVRDLVAKRQAAEEAVKGMADGPRKERTYDLILQHLLGGGFQAAASRSRPRPSTPKKKGQKAEASSQPRSKKSGPRSQIEKLMKEGYFADWKDAGQVDKRLRDKGRHYDIRVIRTALLRLTRDELLQRERRQAEGGRESWMYRKLKA